MSGVILRFFAVTALAAGLAGCATAPRRVLFVGFDGMSGRCVREGAEVPNLRALMKGGSWSCRARTILPSSSAPNWASIFQCSGPELTGYTDWGTKTPMMTPPVLDANGRYPDFVARYRAANPAAKIGFAFEWEGMAHVLDTNACSYVRHGDCSDAAVRDYIRAERPELMMIVFDRPDHPGHDKGWSSPEYLAMVKKLDGFLGEILETYREAGILSDTTVVVTSDHGGIKKQHGGATLDEVERPLVFAGPGIRAGHELRPGTLTTDTGATVAGILGVVAPPVWTGRVLGEIFE